MTYQLRYFQSGPSTNNGRLYIDDVDVTNAISGFTLTINVGEIGHAEVRMPMLGVVAEAEARVTLTAHDERLLDILGWQRKP